MESEKALVVSLHSLQILISDYKSKKDFNQVKILDTNWLCVNGFFIFFPTQAEGQNAKNQQMDPFTRRQCKPTMVSNVR